MKVKNYSYDCFEAYRDKVDGIVELKGNKENLRVRMTDIIYDAPLRIRLLYPNTILDESRKYPIVFHVQGSGWYRQDMNDHIFDFMPIVKAGYAYAIIEVTPSTDSEFPKQIFDIKHAITYLLSHSDAYPIKTECCYLSGDSSGAHNAMLTLFDDGTLDQSRLKLPPFKGLIDLYGIYNMNTLDRWICKYDWKEEGNLYALLGDDLSEAILTKASPKTYLKDAMNLPPVLILHGDKDHVIPFTQSVELYHDLKDYGYQVTFARVKDADHGRSIFYDIDVYNTIIHFLNENR